MMTLSSGALVRVAVDEAADSERDPLQAAQALRSEAQDFAAACGTRAQAMTEDCLRRLEKAHATLGFLLKATKKELSSEQKVHIAETVAEAATYIGEVLGLGEGFLTKFALAPLQERIAGVTEAAAEEGVDAQAAIEAFEATAEAAEDLEDALPRLLTGGAALIELEKPTVLGVLNAVATGSYVLLVGVLDIFYQVACSQSLSNAVKCSIAGGGPLGGYGSPVANIMLPGGDVPWAKWFKKKGK